MMPRARRSSRSGRDGSPAPLSWFSRLSGSAATRPAGGQAWLATQYFYFDTHLTLYAPCCSTVPIRWLKMSRSVWRTGFASACISSTKSG